MKYTILLFCLLFSLNAYLPGAFSYTEEEYAIYKELMDTPMSISEEEAHKIIAKKHGISSKEVKETVDRVMGEVYFGGMSNEEKKRQIKANIVKISKIKILIVSGDFANVGYIETAKAFNDADVKAKVLDSMPKILKLVFSVKGIERVRITAYYPTDREGTMKVASFETDRSEFKPNKKPQQYKSFWCRI